MKKYKLLVGVLIAAMFVLTACGGNGTTETDGRTLNAFIQAVEAEFDGERDTPLYAFIGASGGVMWHQIVGGYSASIYEFEDIPAAEEAASNFGWVSNGRFVLEANDDGLIQFFTSIE